MPACLPPARHSGRMGLIEPGFFIGDVKLGEALLGEQSRGTQFLVGFVKYDRNLELTYSGTGVSPTNPR